MMSPQAYMEPGTQVAGWTILGLAPREAWKSAHRHYEARCECGTVWIINGNTLRRGGNHSCGCRHGQHGFSKTAAYSTWLSMRNRVLRVDDDKYPYYGGRGIQIESAWIDSFPKWFAYVRELPACPFDERGQRTDANKYSLDRINVDGNYEPENLRWATRKEQAANRRPALSKDVNLAVAAIIDRYSLTAVRSALERYEREADHR